MNTTRNFSARGRKFFLPLLLFCLFSVESFATHFRYGTVSWSTVSGNTIQFKISQAWRRSYFGTPVVGSVVNTGVFEFGDGATANVNVLVSAVNTTEDWFFGETTITHTYANPGNYIADFNSCCRISTLTNNHDMNFRVETAVTTGSGNNSPVSNSTPIVNLAAGLSAAQFQIAASDPDGDVLKYRLSTDIEMGGLGLVQPAGLSVDSTGLVTFNTVGKPIGSLWNTQVTVLDGHGAKISVDILIRIIQASNPPQFDYAVTPANGTTYQLHPGNTLTFTVKATDPDAGDIVTLQGIGLPPGSTMTPALPVNGNPVSSTFAWTPGFSNLGTNVISFTAQDLAGTQKATFVTIFVTMKPSFDVPPTPVAGSFNVTTAGNPVNFTLQASDIDTADRVQIFPIDIPSGSSLTPDPSASGNPTTTNFSWTPVLSDWGVHTLNFKATDTYTQSVTHSFDYLVNTPPVFTSAPVLSVYAGHPYLYNITVADPDTLYGDTIDILGGTLPAWLNFHDNGNGTATLSGNPTVADGGTYNIMLEAQDIYHHNNPNPLASVQSFILTVVPCNVSAGIAPSNVTCFGGSNGSADLTVSGASVPLTYAWSNGATTEDLTGVPAGAYSVQVTDANGCTATAGANLTQPDQLIASASAGSIACNGGAATVTVSATGGTAPYSGTGSYTVTAGSYSYTVTDANGCSATASVFISQPEPLAETVVAGVISCNGATTTVTVTASGGTAPYNGTGTFTVGAGTYTYTVTDANGCSNATTITIGQPALLAANAGPDQHVYFGYAPKACATLNGNATGGIPAYAYSWNTGATTASITVCPTITTTYTLTVTDARGCTATGTVRVCVTDVHCAKGGNAIVYYDGGKVLVCHVPGGDYSKRYTMCITADAVPDHLGHGDQLGMCDAICSPARIAPQTPADMITEGEINLMAYPNPFAGVTTVRFSLPENGHVSLKIYNVVGKEVSVLFDGGVTANEPREASFNGSDLASGIYFCRLVTQSGEVKAEKLLLNK